MSRASWQRATLERALPHSPTRSMFARTWLNDSDWVVSYFANVRPCERKPGSKLRLKQHQRAQHTLCTGSTGISSDITMKRTFGDNIVLTVTSRKVHKRRVCCWLIFRSVRQCASEDHQTYRRPLSKPIQGGFCAICRCLCERICWQNRPPSANRMQRSGKKTRKWIACRQLAGKKRLQSS